MKHIVPFRVIVSEPLPGVMMRVQKGRDELISPTSSSMAELVFDFEITVELSSGSPNFLGKFAHGPKDQRFVYVNSGTYAGEHASCWGRRAKLSLMSITKKQIDDTVAGNAAIVTMMPGVGRDGGPTCASVKGIEWKVVRG
ncbi:MAG TPA: DUF5990 family protein [Pyrinomonadaceae bacterium]|nr:DUF5990 family protein [Pyrinomonadaceae bacterium]